LEGAANGPPNTHKQPIVCSTATSTLLYPFPVTPSTITPQDRYKNGRWRPEYEKELASPAPEESGEGVAGREEVGESQFVLSSLASY